MLGAQVTFRMDNMRHARFKIVVAEQGKLIREVVTDMIDQFIEDYDDRTTPSLIEGMHKASEKHSVQEWNIFKRKSGLDGLQTFH